MTHQKRLLVIEDDMDVAELLLMFFNGQGYEVFHADEGEQGIALARSKLPNLILLDIMLPDMDGFDVCRELRSANLTRYIPTLFLTQKNARADKVAGLELGADDYITKPFDIEELRLRVQSSIHRATRENLHERITGLPTGSLIEEQGSNFQQNSSDTWHRLDAKIIGFDAFRDAYGFLTANDALSLATKVLRDHVVDLGTNNDFIGTPETGHFVIYTFTDDINTLSERITEQFAERAQALYHFMHVEQGYVVIDEGTEQEHKAPLMHFDINIQSAVPH